MSVDEIKKGDIVEHLGTGQTFKVVSITADKLKVKGNGTSLMLAMASVKKAPIARCARRAESPPDKGRPVGSRRLSRLRAAALTGLTKWPNSMSPTPATTVAIWRW